MIPMDCDDYELQERIAIILDDLCDRATPEQVAKATEQAKHELKQRKANNDN